MNRFKRGLQKGFTLVEMLVVAPIVILAIGAFLTVIITMVGDVLASRASNTLSYDVQDALNRIEQDVKLSSGFLAANTVIGTAQGRADNATAFTNIDNTNGPSLILNMIATTANPLSTTSSYVFLRDRPNNCATAQGINTPFTYNVVYFLKTDPTSGITSLFRRTLMPLNYADTTTNVCSVPWQQPSCSPDYMDAQSGSVFCRTKDILVVRGLTASNFVIQYFNREDATSVNAPASTAPQIVDRNTALQSVTTVGVSLNAQQEAAGRTIERTATLRVSRLDTNASSIGVISADGIPAVPRVSSTTGEPTTVTFSWPTVAAASGYTLEYQVNGGAWTNGLNNSPLKTFTLSSATHTNVVNARVIAIGPGGSSAFGTSGVTIPLWTPMNLQNGWVDFGTPFGSASYTRTSAGMIVLKGLVRSGSGVVARLPVAYRPGTNEGQIFATTGGSAVGRINVRPNGDVTVEFGSNANISLDGITFMPDGLTWTPMSPLLNGWLDFTTSGDISWSSPEYLTDSDGRVHTRGMVRAGITTSGTPVTNLPVNSRPAQYLHLVNLSNNALTHIGIDTTGNVQAKSGANNGWLALQSMFIPSGRATGTNCTTQWCNLSLINAWAWLGAPWSTPQYTETADGMVLLKGMVRSGTGVMAALPAGFCPREQLIFTTVAADVWGRVDVSASSGSGCNILYVAGSTGWQSLDAITFMSEI